MRQAPRTASAAQSAIAGLLRAMPSLRRGRKRPAARTRRRAYAKPAVRERHGAAEKHDQRAEPDEAHERVEVEAHGNAAVRLRIAQHRVEITAPGGMNAG